MTCLLTCTSVRKPLLKRSNPLARDRRVRELYATFGFRFLSSATVGHSPCLSSFSRGAFLPLRTRRELWFAVREGAAQQGFEPDGFFRIDVVVAAVGLATAAAFPRARVGLLCRRPRVKPRDVGQWGERTKRRGDVGAAVVGRGKVIRVLC